MTRTMSTFRTSAKCSSSSGVDASSSACATQLMQLSLSQQLEDGKKVREVHTGLSDSPSHSAEYPTYGLNNLLHRRLRQPVQEQAHH